MKNILCKLIGLGFSVSIPFVLISCNSGNDSAQSSSGQNQYLSYIYGTNGNIIFHTNSRPINIQVFAESDVVTSASCAQDACYISSENQIVKTTDWVKFEPVKLVASIGHIKKIKTNYHGGLLVLHDEGQLDLVNLANGSVAQVKSGVFDFDRVSKESFAIIKQNTNNSIQRVLELISYDGGTANVIKQSMIDQNQNYIDCNNAGACLTIGKNVVGVSRDQGQNWKNILLESNVELTSLSYSPGSDFYVGGKNKYLAKIDDHDNVSKINLPTHPSGGNYSLSAIYMTGSANKYDLFAGIKLDNDDTPGYYEIKCPASEQSGKNENCVFTFLTSQTEGNLLNKSQMNLNATGVGDTAIPNNGSGATTLLEKVVEALNRIVQSVVYVLDLGSKINLEFLTGLETDGTVNSMAVSNNGGLLFAATSSNKLETYIINYANGGLVKYPNQTINLGDIKPQEIATDPVTNLLVVVGVEKSFYTDTQHILVYRINNTPDESGRFLVQLEDSAIQRNAEATGLVSYGSRFYLTLTTKPYISETTRNWVEFYPMQPVTGRISSGTVIINSGAGNSNNLSSEEIPTGLSVSNDQTEIFISSKDSSVITYSSKNLFSPKRIKKAPILLNGLSNISYVPEHLAMISNTKSNSPLMFTLIDDTSLLNGNAAKMITYQSVKDKGKLAGVSIVNQADLSSNLGSADPLELVVTPNNQYLFVATDESVKGILIYRLSVK